jgi:hypothetical protein
LNDPIANETHFCIKILSTLFSNRLPKINFKNYNKCFRIIYKTVVKANYAFFFLWLYNPIQALAASMKTFRFTSVTRSRTVGRTPWTGDQLVARPLIYIRI